MARTVISAATVITMEKELGEIPAADILIDGERIAAIEQAGRISSQIKDAEVIDGRKFIVIPGFINAHLHTWQTSLRSIVVLWSTVGMAPINQGSCSGIELVVCADQIRDAHILGSEH